MIKSFNKNVKKDFEFSYDPPLSSEDGCKVTHETYTFIADVAMEVASREIGDGQQASFSYFVKINKIRKYRVDNSGFDIVDLDSVLDAHGKNSPDVRREIVEAIAHDALERIPMIRKYSVMDLMADLALENSAANGRKTR